VRTRLSARDTDEEQLDEAHEHVHADDEDEQQQQQRQRAERALREPGERREQRAGQARRVRLGRFELRERQEEPEVDHADRQRPAPDDQRSEQACAQRAGADHLDRADPDRGDPLRVLNRELARLFGQLTDPAQQVQRDQPEEHDERDREHRLSDVAAPALGLERLANARCDPPGVDLERLTRARGVLGVELHDRHVASEDRATFVLGNDPEVPRRGAQRVLERARCGPRPRLRARLVALARELEHDGIAQLDIGRCGRAGSLRLNGERRLTGARPRCDQRDQHQRHEHLNGGGHPFGEPDRERTADPGAPTPIVRPLHSSTRVPSEAPYSRFLSGRAQELTPRPRRVTSQPHQPATVIPSAARGI
jgi:hypothetical protein